MALTSSSYGPRLVRNFMADSGNQLVLGVYVATFLYSLLVMRSIRVELDGQEFVPHLAVTVALLLAVAHQLLATRRFDEAFVKRRRDKARVDKKDNGIGDVRISQATDVYRAPTATRHEAAE